MLLLIFFISIAVLLLCIIKIKLNPFVALLVCAYGTGLMALATYIGGTAPSGFASITDITACVTNNFGSTLGSIGIVTGLGVMLGMFMYESGGIDSIVDKVLKAVGPKRSQYAVSVALQKSGYEIVPISKLIYKENFYIDQRGRQYKK